MDNIIEMPVGNLDLDKRGNVKNSIGNFEAILRYDSYFKGLKFNLLTFSPEKFVDGCAEGWADVDDSSARAYIENEFGILSRNNLDDALRIVFMERQYHPVKDAIECVTWDGVERVEMLLTKWMQCENSEYTREVSRLIFAGGINRIYLPGCKFDYMPVLVGTLQGEGKSTFVRWLAIQDDFYNEITDIDGQKGIEAIEGAWVCEIGELLAFTKTKDVEAIKSYITRQVDKYRRPYDKRVSDAPRQCIFIGTTNKIKFLTDKTGNRRFLPVRVRVDGYSLFDHESEIKHDILQCWAEAKTKFDAGEMQPVPPRSLIPVIRQYQESALEDDYREGLIKEYIESRDRVCVIEIWRNALRNDFNTPSKKDSSDISEILQRLGWEGSPSGNERFTGFGSQRAFVRPLPFGQGKIITDNDKIITG